MFFFNYETQIQKLFLKVFFLLIINISYGNESELNKLHYFSRGKVDPTTSTLNEGFTLYPNIILRIPEGTDPSGGSAHESYCI